MTHRLLLTIVLTLVIGSGRAFADVTLPGLISDHMVLQRGVPARVFGKADPGEAVRVSFRGQTVQAVADALGRWEAWLQPLSPGPAASMTVAGRNTITIADVLVGDVWIGSGQSTCSGPSGSPTTPLPRSPERRARISGCSGDKED